MRGLTLSPRVDPRPQSGRYALIDLFRIWQLSRFGVPLDITGHYDPSIFPEVHLVETKPVRVGPCLSIEHGRNRRSRWAEPERHHLRKQHLRDLTDVGTLLHPQRTCTNALDRRFDFGFAGPLLLLLQLEEAVVCESKDLRETHPNLDVIFAQFPCQNG